MQKKIFSRGYFSVPDVVILFLVATLIYGVVAIGNEWRGDFHPVTEIDLSIWSLPYYTILSAVRGTVAYLVSLGFTLIVGYLAAKSRNAERVIIPLLDILQSIPVLGFLPGLSLGLVALFPHTNTGLELAAIIMIFTGQVWNMTFSYYASLKSVPEDFKEASRVIGFNWKQRLQKVELPFSAVNLAWNSLLSMAGGWFFLIPCEAFTLGDKEYRLPGIGAYMDVAIKQQNRGAICSAVVAMVLLIVLMDFTIWRPILSWVQRFRLEDVPGAGLTEPLMQVWIREARILRWTKVGYRALLHRYHSRRMKALGREVTVNEFVRERVPQVHRVWVQLMNRRQSPWISKLVFISIWALICCFVGFGALKLLKVLSRVSPATWWILFRDTFWTFLRVFFALAISTIWALPVGIWIGTSKKRIRLAQPIIQVLASFPAPMLYPLVLGVLFSLGISFDWGAMFLMLLGVQWYVLFNVLAGALRIPQELSYALAFMEASRWDRWRVLYLPSVFPALVTGWVTAAGGAWNASVVAEYLFYRGGILKTAGLGATLSVATANEDFSLFAASLTLMVCVVILLNRVVWSKVYQLAQTRFRMDS